MAAGARRQDRTGEIGGEELSGTLLSITFRNEDNGYTVGRVEVEGARDPLTVVGPMPGVEIGDTLRLVGRHVTHPSFGRQFEVRRCELRPPSGRLGLVRFLGGGRIKGVGPKTAEKIVDALGLDVLDRLRAEPRLLETVPGLSRARAEAILGQLEEQRAAAGALVFLADHGLGPALAQRVWKRYGERTVELVRANPYRLADEVAGIGFRVADGLAAQLGLDPESDFRIACGLRWLLGQAAAQGHCGLPAEELVRHAAEFLGVDEARAESVLVERLSAGELVEDGLVYRPELLLAEKLVALHLLRRIDEGEPVLRLPPGEAARQAAESSGFELADDQRRALDVLLGSPVAVLTGGPGVGKTTIVRCLVDLLRRHDRRFALAAPTGRAARRLAEATGSEASTLHRLLGLLPGETGLRALRDEPLDVDVLVVDEVSMVDVELMSEVCQALPPGAGLLLVGDADQLPSVGPGEVLRALVGSGAVPVARLTTIFRQAGNSGIVRVAHELNAGEVPRFDEGPGGEAFFVEREEPAAVLETLLGLVSERIPKRFGLLPLRDVQVVTPMHGGPLGTVALNDALREALNPPGEGRPELRRFGRLFRLGDKVMQVRNNYDVDVFNGDIGTIARLDEDDGVVHVRFDDRLVEYALDALDQLEPAFAITCHKSQGSEFPAVVMPIVTAHAIMLRRNLVYTAFTRARRVLCAVGQSRALRMAAASPGAGHRHGRLAERLRGEA